MRFSIVALFASFLLAGSVIGTPLPATKPASPVPTSQSDGVGGSGGVKPVIKSTIHRTNVKPAVADSLPAANTITFPAPAADGLSVAGFPSTVDVTTSSGDVSVPPTKVANQPRAKIIVFRQDAALQD